MSISLISSDFSTSDIFDWKGINLNSIHDSYIPSSHKSKLVSHKTLKDSLLFPKYCLTDRQENGRTLTSIRISFA
jgi:hypothetical protein